MPSIDKKRSAAACVADDDTGDHGGGRTAESLRKMGTIKPVDCRTAVVSLDAKTPIQAVRAVGRAFVQTCFGKIQNARENLRKRGRVVLQVETRRSVFRPCTEPARPDGFGLWHKCGSGAGRSDRSGLVLRSSGLLQGLTLATCLAVMLTAGMAQAKAVRWKVMPDPVWEGQYAAVGDPSVLHVTEGYLMFHHCLDVERQPQGGEICLAQSKDGLDWRYARTELSSSLVRGRLLQAQIGGWDEAHETPFAQVVDGDIRLYVLGYKGSGFFVDPTSSGIGLVTSADPLRFGPMPPPVLVPSVRGDMGGITSPSVVRTPKGAVLYYTGWACSMADQACLTGAVTQQLSLMAVPLNRQGLPQGAPQVIVGDPGLNWTNGGISEAQVVAGPDGRYYLFFSSLSGPAGRPNAVQRIGLAVAKDPFGPFRFTEAPLIEPGDVTGIWTNGGVLAPSVLIEDGRLRLWFHAFETDSAGAIVKARIGYAEHVWPLE